jgi:O-antigen biosynthesis protein WbqP
MKRYFDLIIATMLLSLLLVPMLLISILIKLTSKGPIIYWSNRNGANNSNFKMPKFRSMKTNAPQLATHLLVNPDQFLTPIGRILRKTSLDELPQIFSVIQGHMSFIGPRPALFNQIDLIDLREQHGLDFLPPGITGWAQVNGRDNLSIHEKVMLEKFYRDNRTLLLDIKIIWLTLIKVMKTNEISH